MKKIKKVDEIDGLQKVVYSYGDYLEVPTAVMVLEYIFLDLCCVWHPNNCDDCYERLRDCQKSG
ncbi:MAG: hypothetical protein ACI4DO_02555 [Roseburia sp.]